jgi:rod shape-determining protein MreD
VRNLGVVALGLGLLLLQDSLFRVLDGLTPLRAGLLLMLALGLDGLHVMRQLRGAYPQARSIGLFRADASLPAAGLLAYALATSVGHAHFGRPIPSLVLPLILFMGVHEYPLARGAWVAFFLGYGTDLLGIAPVGLFTFTYVATFVLARAAGVRLAAQTPWMQVLLVAAFTLVESTVVLVLLAIFGRDASVPRSLYVLALPHALATAAVAPFVFRLAQAVYSATTGALRGEASGGAGA